MGLRKRGDVWYADYSVTDPVSGNSQRIQKSLKTGEKAVAQALHDELMGKMQRQKLGLEPLQKPWPTVAQARKEYLEHVRFRRRERTAYGYEHDLDAILNWMGVSLVSDISMDLVEAYQRQEADRVSGRSVNRVVTALQGMLNWLRNRKKISFNPIQGIERVEESPQEHYPITEQERDIILAKVKRTDTRDALAFFFFTGLRASQLMGLTPAHIQRERERLILHIPKELAKNKKAWKLPLCPEAAEIVQQRLQKGGEYLFQNEHGQRWGRVLRARFQAACKAAGIHALDSEGREMKLNLHTIRHAFNNHLRQRGVDAKTRQYLMQHLTLDVTENIYSHAYWGDIVTGAESLCDKSVTPTDANKPKLLAV